MPKPSKHDEKLLVEAKARKEKEKQRYFQKKQERLEAGLCFLETYVPRAAKEDALALVNNYVRCLNTGETPDYITTPLAESDPRYWRPNRESDIILLDEDQTSQKKDFRVGARKTPYKVRRAQQSKRSRARKVNLGLVKVKFTIPIPVRNQILSIVEVFVRMLSEGQLMSVRERVNAVPPAISEEGLIDLSMGMGHNSVGKLYDLFDEQSGPQSCEDDVADTLFNDIKSLGDRLK